MGQVIHFRAQHCQKYASYPKMLQIKVVEHQIAYKKGSGRICRSPRGVELGGSRGCPLK